LVVFFLLFEHFYFLKYLYIKFNMNSTVINNINEIGFLMNYQTGKTIKEQKIFDVYNENFINEAPVPGAKPQQKPGQQQGQQQKLTPEQMAAAKAKVQAQSKKTAEAIFQELKKAMDMDGDNVFNDYDGTNEGGVVAAIKKIKNKEVLDYLNQRVKQTKQYGNLKSWINAELSDFDSEYGQIWKKLESLGYAGANYNILLKFAGQTGVGQLIKAGDKAIDKLRSMSLKDIMEGFREIVGGVAGTIAQLILGVLGPIGTGVNFLINGVLVVWDISVLSTKGLSGEYIFNLILDITSSVLAVLPGGGAAKAELKEAGPVLKEAQSAESFFALLAKKFPKISKFFTSVGKTLASLGGKLAGYAEKGIAWLVSKLPFLSKLMSPIKAAIGKIGTFLASIASAIGKSTGKLVEKGIESLAKYKAVNYMATWGKSLAKSFGKGILQKLETKLGQKIVETLDKKAVTKIEDYLWENGEKLTVDQARPIVCKWGVAYCTTFDIMANTVLVAKEGKKAIESIKTGGEKLDKIKGAENLVGKVKTGAEGVEKITKGTKEALKTTNKSIEGAEQVVGDVQRGDYKNQQQTGQGIQTGGAIATKQVQPKKQPVPMAEDVLEEIREINRYMRVIL
jgi:hypothetical protein